MSVAIRAGSLRHEVVLQRPGTRVDDGMGGGSVTDADLATVWASIEPLTGDELFQAGQFDPRVNYRITIRYYAGIHPSDKVKFGTRMFDIHTVANVDERNRMIVLMCEELVTW